MKVRRLGKEYEYEYKTILIYERNHRKLMRISKENKLSMNKMLTKLLELYENNNDTNG
jgi:galactose-1-phosphate uridylyltransferase